MSFYGRTLYGKDHYAGVSYSHIVTERSVRIRAKIIHELPSEPLPVFDTIVRGLATYFDFLQQGIQAFSLFNKIEYATGKRDSILPSLDDVWGVLYNLPRLAGESDFEYRKRLQTYIKALIGSGTIPACQEVIDILLDMPGVTIIKSVYPARAVITFRDANAIRVARDRIELLNNTLPGLFAAGVEYDLKLTLVDSYITAYVRGDATAEYAIRAAIRSDAECSTAISATVAWQRTEASGILVAFCTQRDATSYIQSTIRAERDLSARLYAAIQSQPIAELSLCATIRSERLALCDLISAIRADCELNASVSAAISRTFEMTGRISARVTISSELNSSIKAAVRSRREANAGIRARIARRIE